MLSILKLLLPKFVRGALRDKQWTMEKKIRTNPYIRWMVTRGYTCGKLALGERNSYAFPLDWVRVDWEEADFNLDFVKSPKLPMTENSQSIIYSAHMIEHLPDQTLDLLFSECFRVLAPGGHLRLEAPDVELIMNAYKNRDAKFLNHMRRYRKEFLLDKFRYDARYLEDHLSLLGAISCYIVPGEGPHVPVYVPVEEFEKKINSLQLDDFAAWCVSLQSPEQLRSGGHQNIIYLDKIKRMLESNGFVNITRQEFGRTSIPNLLLNKGFNSIQEKKHRAPWSLYVEAEKPRNTNTLPSIHGQ